MGHVRSKTWSLGEFLEKTAFAAMHGPHSGLIQLLCPLKSAETRSKSDKLGQE